MSSLKLMAAAILALILLVPSGLWGSSGKSPVFAPWVSAEGHRLEIRGTARLNTLFFIKAYDGAFYLPKGVPGTAALETVPRHLVLAYHVAIAAEDLARATRAKIRDGVDPDLFQRLLPKIEALNRLYRNVAPGDRYALTYVPGTGTRLIFNGRVLGTIAGPEFARALFSIWIGDTPIDPDFRDRLLGAG